MREDRAGEARGAAPGSRSRSQRSPALFLQGEDPAHQRLGIGVGHLRVGGHGNLSPYAGSARLHLLREPPERASVAAILGGNVLVCRAEHLLVDGVTRKAAILLHHRLARLEVSGATAPAAAAVALP